MSDLPASPNIINSTPLPTAKGEPPPAVVEPLGAPKPPRPDEVKAEERQAEEMIDRLEKQQPISKRLLGGRAGKIVAGVGMFILLGGLGAGVYLNSQNFGVFDPRRYAVDNTCNVTGGCSSDADWEAGWYAAREGGGGGVAIQPEYTNAHDDQDPGTPGQQVTNISTGQTYDVVYQTSTADNAGVITQLGPAGSAPGGPSSVTAGEWAGWDPQSGTGAVSAASLASAGWQFRYGTGNRGSSFLEANFCIGQPEIGCAAYNPTFIQGSYQLVTGACAFFDGSCINQLAIPPECQTSGCWVQIDTTSGFESYYYSPTTFTTTTTTTSGGDNGGGDEGPPPPPPPPPQTLACDDLATSKAVPVVGDTLSLTCFSAGDKVPDHFEFRYTSDGGRNWNSLASGIASLTGARYIGTSSLVVSTSASYQIECRVCEDAASTKCTDWGLQL